ncbi:hypothetical protein VTL71DRAFT_12066 [Oculimacula yallundae]|uniref:BTB domain-containing protein n=1 Tax=Oculimacula yallundae TaxID=86028 RepID=A0ABR4CRU2_9HELO
MSSSTPEPNGVSDQANNAVRKERPEKQKLPKPDFSEPATFVTFLVGPEDYITKFVVHKEFACYHSSVLRAAFASNFVEGQTQTYRIIDTSPDAFQLFVQWLYTQKLQLHRLRHLEASGLTDESGEDEEYDMGDEDMSLAKLWVLADKLAIPKLQNSAMTCILKFASGNVIPTLPYHYIYENTGIGSPLRRLVVEQCAHELPHYYIYSCAEYFPRELLLDIFAYTAKNFRDDRDSLPDPRKFYVAED